MSYVWEWQRHEAENQLERPCQQGHPSSDLGRLGTVSHYCTYIVHRVACRYCSAGPFQWLCPCAGSANPQRHDSVHFRGQVLTHCTFRSYLLCLLQLLCPVEAEKRAPAPTGSRGLHKAPQPAATRCIQCEPSAFEGGKKGSREATTQADSKGNIADHQKPHGASVQPSPEINFSRGLQHRTVRETSRKI